jgi:hypothetical protein
MPVSDKNVSRTSNTVSVLYNVHLASDKLGRRADSLSNLTECSGKVANFAASCSGGTGFKSNPRGLPSGPRFFNGFLLSFQGYGETVPQIGQ